MEIVKQDQGLTIPGYENYTVNHLGVVRRGQKQLKTTLVKSGYVTVALSKNGIPKTYTVHRLVALAFWGPSNLVVDHRNGNKSDNRLSNLRYCTQRENISEGLNVTNITGITGVSLNSEKYQNRFRARIRINGKLNDLGSFYTAQLAGIAYQNAKQKLISF